eukprot:5287661-Pyramimonas_sp.AAC.1
MWLATTRTLRRQHGYLIYFYARDNFNITINEFTEDQLSSDGSGQGVVKHLKKSFAEYPGCRMPKACGQLFYSDDAK